MEDDILGYAPPPVDAGKLQRALIDHRAQMQQLRKDIAYQGELIDDLYSMVEFLSKNPGSNISDWVKYAAVKTKMQEAA
jgi:hypothetical protein